MTPLKSITLFIVVSTTILSPCFSQERLPSTQGAINGLEKYFNTLKNDVEYKIVRLQDDSKPVFRVKIKNNNVWCQYHESNSNSIYETISRNDDYWLKASLDRSFDLSQYDSLNYRTGGAPIVLRSVLDKQNGVLQAFESFGLHEFLGYVKNKKGVRDIISLLNEGRATISWDEIDAKNFALLETPDGTGAIKIWLNPGYGYAAHKIRISFSKPQPGEAEVLDYKVNQFQRIDDTDVPKEFTKYCKRAGGTIKEENGQESKFNPVEYSFVYSLTEVRFDCSFADSDFDLSFAKDIPNGVPVSIKDASHLKFMWQDGEIVPATDVILEAWADKKPSSESGSHHFWSVILGVIGMVAVAGVVIFFAVAVLRGKEHRRRPLLGAMCCLAVFVVAAMANYLFIDLVHLPSVASEDRRQRQEPIDAASFVHVGDPAPSFTITDINGTEFDLDDLRGKVVLVNFFATWCGPCLMELPYIQKLWEENRDNNSFALIVIGREETDESITAFQSKHGYSFPLASDSERSVYSRYAKELIPRTYLVSPDGRICYASSGFNEQDLIELQRELTKQLQTIR